MDAKYSIKITVPEGFDTADDSFQNMEATIVQMINMPEFESTVFLNVRIPDDYNLQINEENINTLMSALRELVLKETDKLYLFATQFDVSCIEDANKIVQVDNMFTEEWTMESLLLHIQKLASLYAPKIILPSES